MAIALCTRLLLLQWFDIDRSVFQVSLLFRVEDRLSTGTRMLKGVNIEDRLTRGGGLRRAEKSAESRTWAHLEVHHNKRWANSALASCLLLGLELELLGAADLPREAAWL